MTRRERDKGNVIAVEASVQELPEWLVIDQGGVVIRSVRGRDKSDARATFKKVMRLDRVPAGWTLRKAES